MHKRIKFKKEQFDLRGGHFPTGWHVLNEAAGQQGEHTLCGIAYDGDGINAFAEPTIEKEGKATCENCLAVIRFCKQIKN